jgi:hypothetical protein
MTKSEEAQHYVYLYRDAKKNPRYVGYGKSSDRAVSHLSGSHNDGLNALLESENYTLEIAGPFYDENTARSVETALISALQPDCNINPGQARWRFRPLGVPEYFADRLSAEALTKADFLQLQKETQQSLLFVRIGDKNFGDGRGGGYNPANPPGDAQILERMDRWWRLGRYVTEWENIPPHSPMVLVGINGKPGAQVIIGSVTIDISGWGTAKSEKGFYIVPTLKTPDLDALDLRGRRVSKEANIRFGSFYSQIFLILKPDGTILGGNPLPTEG